MFTMQFHFERFFEFFIKNKTENVLANKCIGKVHSIQQIEIVHYCNTFYTEVFKKDLSNLSISFAIYLTLIFSRLNTNYICLKCIDNVTW